MGESIAGNIGTRTKRHFTIGANHPLQRNLPESRLDWKWLSNLQTKFISKIIIEARNLQPHPSTFTLDPYCIITCEFGYDRSLTIWNNLNPVWDEEYYLYIFTFLSSLLLSLPFSSPPFLLSLLSLSLVSFHPHFPFSFLHFYCEKGCIHYKSTYSYLPFPSSILKDRDRDTPFLFYTLVSTFQVIQDFLVLEYPLPYSAFFILKYKKLIEWLWLGNWGNGDCAGGINNNKKYDKGW